ncbi:hypothetical protein LTR85_010629 [Meristemomyces frigidus]|nr:hypothetical protein LTR85_010629 [Meristemomyces frigidus]
MAAYDPSGLPNMDDEPSNENGEEAYDHQDDGDEDDDYDPSSFSFGDSAAEPTAQQDTVMPDQPQPVPATTEVSATEQTTKPRTVGGFIVEESDEEDEEDMAPVPSQSNGTEGTQSGLGATAVSEAAQDVSLASEPTQDSAAAQQSAQASLNGSAATAITTLPGVPDALVAPSAVSASDASLTAQQDQGKQEDISAGTNGTVSISATPKPSVNGVTAPPDHTVPPTPTSARLPHDKVGRLEDRIKDDPKADTQAWLELIAHYREKDQIDNVRRVYDRMLEVFPTAPSLYVSYLHLELEVFDRHRIDTLFGLSLPQVPNVDLWKMYLDYLRRVFPLIPDPQGQNRTLITNGFEAVLDAVGIDPDAGNLWREYVDFAKSGPGIVGGSGWQDQQKGDMVRKAYQRAVKVPTSELLRLWKEYDSFEMTINKAQGRKFLQELGPHYMSARSELHHLERITDGLDRRSLPILPPVHGFEGEEQFGSQVQKWRNWIEWEKTDPLALRGDEMPLYRKRVLYAYKQATIQLRLYPDIWFEAAQWCFEELVEEMVAQGEDFLDQGLKANPESVLLALKKADRLEESFDLGSTDDGTVVANGDKLDVPFEECHTVLYSLREKMVEREKKAVQKIKEDFAALSPEEEPEEPQMDDDDDDENAPDVEKPLTRQQQMEAQIKSLTTASRAQLDVLKRTISYVWVAKMRAFRRVQGQGLPGKAKKGFRGVFGEARPRGQLSSEVYIASALMEWHCYKDQSALKIFERGLKLFPQDQEFALAYVKFLVECRGDLVNARVVFETTLTKILGPGSAANQNANAVVSKEAEEEERKRKEKVRPLLGFMHEFESSYGDMAQIKKLEKRMKDLFPQEPEIVRFGLRNSMPTFDGLQAELVISPTQARPKSTYQAMGMQGALPSLEVPGRGEGGLRLGPNGPYVASPKRPLDDSDMDADTPQRKFMRGESPLKGAAGRRITGNGMGHMATGSTASGSGAVGGVGGAAGFMTKNYIPGNGPPNGGMQAPPPVPAGPIPLPREVTYLLSILPHSAAYNAVTFIPNRVVEFLSRLDLEPARGRAMAVPAGTAGGGGYGGR